MPWDIHYRLYKIVTRAQPLESTVQLNEPVEGYFWGSIPYRMN